MGDPRHDRPVAGEHNKEQLGGRASALLPITLHNVTYRAGEVRVIDGLSACIAARGLTALVGPNGAGKSTCLRLIDGLIAPAAGSIGFGGSGARPQRRAFVFQRTALLRASVAANVALGLWPQRLGRADARERVAAALAAVGLAGREREAAGHLSGGERQKLGLARALASDPDLLLLDEPTASLDPATTGEIERVIAAAVAGGTKVILVSHQLGQVARLAADVLVLAKGAVVEHGAPGDVFAAPRHPATRSFLNGELP